MFKKIVAVIVTALACNSAFAGFIQYDLDARFDDGATLSGYFIQNTDDNAIAYYFLRADGSDTAPGSDYFASGDFGNVLSARQYVRGGPTSFTLFSDLSDAYYAELDLSFRMGANGAIQVTGSEYTNPYWWVEEWDVQPSYRQVIGGSVTRVQVEANLLAALEAGEGFSVIHIVPDPAPAPVPEPGSLALLAIGALGAAGLRRRRAAR